MSSLFANVPFGNLIRKKDLLQRIKTDSRFGEVDKLAALRELITTTINMGCGLPSEKCAKQILLAEMYALAAQITPTIDSAQILCLAALDCLDQLEEQEGYPVEQELIESNAMIAACNTYGVSTYAEAIAAIQPLIDEILLEESPTHRVVPLR